MKKTILSMFFVAMSAMSFGQTCDIPLQVVVSDDIEGMTTQSANYIKNVIRHTMVKGDGVGAIENSQFGIVVKADIVDKHIIAGAPQKTILNLCLSLYMGDVREGTLFSSYTTEINGVGNNDTKAYNNAFRKLNANNSDLIKFAEQGKKKLIEYYDRNYQNVIKKAQTQASLRNYEEALYHLMSIPECCKGYDLAMAEVKKVYKQFVDRQCEENLAQAQAAWMSGFTKENAAVASVFLSEIYPDAACYGDAQQLVREIKKHMGEEWKFELKRWDDKVRIELQQMRYAREIALAFAQNQPQETINLIYR